MTFPQHWQAMIEHHETTPEQTYTWANWIKTKAPQQNPTPVEIRPTPKLGAPERKLADLDTTKFHIHWRPDADHQDGFRRIEPLLCKESETVVANGRCHLLGTLFFLVARRVQYMIIELAEVGELIPHREDWPLVDQGAWRGSGLGSLQRDVALRPEHDVVDRQVRVLCRVCSEVGEHPRPDDSVDHRGEVAASIGIGGAGDHIHDSLVLRIGRGLVRRYRARNDAVPEVVCVQMNAFAVTAGKFRGEGRLPCPWWAGQNDHLCAHAPQPIPISTAEAPDFPGLGPVFSPNDAAMSCEASPPSCSRFGREHFGPEIALRVGPRWQFAAMHPDRAFSCG